MILKKLNIIIYTIVIIKSFQFIMITSNNVIISIVISIKLTNNTNKPLNNILYI